MKNLTNLINEQFSLMCKTGHLFRTSTDGEELWITYLKGFHEDPVFRDPKSSLHNCNYCHMFIKRYGNIVAINDNLEIMTLFDLDLNKVEDEYKDPIKSLSEFIRKHKVVSPFVETYNFLNSPRTPYETKLTKRKEFYKLGVESNIKIYNKEDINRYPNSPVVLNQKLVFNHLFIKVPKEFIYFGDLSREAIEGEFKSKLSVFNRTLSEFSIETLDLITDLEAQGSLLNGSSYKYLIDSFRNLKKEYETIEDSKKNNWICKKISELGPSNPVLSIRNTAIGTLMIDLNEGKDINESCLAFNKIVDPANYRKATAPITKKQIEEAKKFVEENGYTESLNRRCATIDDIKVCDILHVNQSPEIKTKLSVFDNVKPNETGKSNNLNLKKVEEISIEKFMNEILPGCTSVEAYLESRLEKNFMTLITSEDKDSKSLFKWSNNFSWTYNGGLAGKSFIKQAVKSVGGFVDAPLRFSIMWNEDHRSLVDFDAHCIEPDDHIYFGCHNIGKKLDMFNRVKSSSGGVIDIDMIRPEGVGIENIFYKDINTLKPGTFEFLVNNYDRGHNTGIKAELVFNDQVYTFIVPREIKTKVKFAELRKDLNGSITIVPEEEYLTESENVSKDIWGLSTNNFYKVNLVCNSPNFWQETGVGNKHYFFMLEGAKSPKPIRTIHNEFLNDELLKHRKVFEALGSTLKCESTEGQLSGLGFNATVRDEIILRLGGSHKRIIKVKF